MDAVTDLCPFCGSDGGRRLRAVVSPLNGKIYDHIACASCGLEFFSPLVFEDVYSTEVYKDYAGIHEGRADQVPLWTREVLRRVGQYLGGDLRNTSLLDVGCGNGVVFHWLAREGGLTAENYVGVDIDGKSLEAARRLGAVNLFRNFFDEEFAAGRAGAFDAVVCTEVIEHTLRPREFMTNLLRVAKPGGWIFLTTPNRERFLIAQREIQGDLPPHHFLRFDKAFFARNFPTEFVKAYDLRERLNWRASARAVSRTKTGRESLWPLFLPAVWALRLLDVLRGKNILIVLRRPPLP